MFLVITACTAVATAPARLSVVCSGLSDLVAVSLRMDWDTNGVFRAKLSSIFGIAAGGCLCIEESVHSEVMRQIGFVAAVSACRLAGFSCVSAAGEIWIEESVPQKWWPACPWRTDMCLVPGARGRNYCRASVWFGLSLTTRA